MCVTVRVGAMGMEGRGGMGGGEGGERGWGVDALFMKKRKKTIFFFK